MCVVVCKILFLIRNWIYSCFCQEWILGSRSHSTFIWLHKPLCVFRKTSFIKLIKSCVWIASRYHRNLLFTSCFPHFYSSWNTLWFYFWSLVLQWFTAIVFHQCCIVSLWRLRSCLLMVFSSLPVLLAVMFPESDLFCSACGNSLNTLQVIYKLILALDLSSHQHKWNANETKNILYVDYRLW